VTFDPNGGTIASLKQLSKGFDMICPHCKNDLLVDDAALSNADRHSCTVLVKAQCCGKGVHVIPKRAFDAQAYYGNRTEDDWGNDIKKAN
jgi:hypothetical protein